MVKLIQNKLMFYIIFSVLAALTSALFIDLYLNFDKLTNLRIIETQKFYNLLTLTTLILLILSSKLTFKRFFTSYSIFLIIMLIFNLGQPLMWSLNITSINQLGVSTHIRQLSADIILLTTSFTLAIFIIFMLGMYFAFNQKFKNANKIKNDANYKFIGFIMFLVSTPFVFLRIYQTIIFASTSGYTELYYGDFEQGGLLLYFEFLFFPSIVMIQLFFNKKSLLSILSILAFIMYIILYISIGDRGNWLYKLISLIVLIMYRNNKKTNLKFILTVSLLALLIYPIIDTFVEYRNNINISTIINESLTKYNLNSYIEILAKPIFEMGQSMRVQAFILQDKLYNNWEFGNTYIAGILNMILPRIKTWFGYPDFYLENWFSQDYLNLTNYGVGFTNVSEMLINFGPFGSLFFASLLGFIFGSILNFKNLSNRKYIFVAIVSLSILLGTTRGLMEYFLRYYFWGIIFPLLVIFILNKIKFRGFKL